MKKRKIPFGFPIVDYHEIKQVSNVLKGNVFAHGPKITKFESNFSKYTGAPYSVSVSGEVQFPTSHLHEDDLDLDDYLKRSGGFTQNADKDRTFVVKANGAVMTKGGNAWFGKGNSTNRIQAGDVIVVPIDVKQTRFLENLTYGTQIIYQLAVAAAAVNSF